MNQTTHRPADSSDQATLRELVSQIADLPGEIRYRLGRYARAPEELAHVVSAIQEAIEGLAVDSSEDELRVAATRLRAQIGLGLTILAGLSSFSGEIEGLGWACGLRELVNEAREKASEP